MSRIRYFNFWLFLAALVGIALTLGPTVGPPRAVLLGFDVGAVLFIVGTLWTIRGAETDDMRGWAKANDPDHHILLLIALLIVAVVLVAVTVELTGAGGGEGSAVAIAGATLLLAWLFGNLLFALHYAHRFYSPDDDAAGRGAGDAAGRGDGAAHDRGGLDFPGDAMPDYGDFAYFAFVLGMTFQVSDVDITARSMRRLALAHSMIAFVFNIVVVALSVSLIGNLLQK